MSNYPESLSNRINKAIRSRYPVIYIAGWEETRIERVLQSVSNELYGDARPVYVWTAANGFSHLGHEQDNLKDPFAALQHISDGNQKAFFLMKDLPEYFASQPLLTRTIRDLYAGMIGKNCYIILSHPVITLPEALKKEVYVVEMNLPTEREIFEVIKRLAGKSSLRKSLDDNWLYRCAEAMRGLSLNEVRHLFHRLAAEKIIDQDQALTEIYRDKGQSLLKESCLELIPNTLDLDQIGGLDRLKDWVINNGRVFTKKAHDAGIPLPSGVLFMGVSGCGKSMASKTIAAAWNLQLVRLDMNLIMSGAYGSPEYAFSRATKYAETIAPIVLWIDEIENSFGYDEQATASGNVNIFSSFLTWMQEKPSTVFVTATANRIKKLPAEMIRKGRFDQVFFLDLPNEAERKAITRIHIEKQGGNVDNFDLDIFSILTEQWTGAEIEQAIKSARVLAYADNRPFVQRDITRSMGQIVPLSKTMHEQVNELRYWSVDRATPASSKTVLSSE